MRCKKSHDDFFEDVLAIMETFPHVEPCSQFRKADVRRFVKHVREDKCEQCLAFHRQTDKELKTIKLLWEFRNRNIH